MITSEEPKVSQTGRYSVTETCGILNISRVTLYRLTNSRFIRCGYRRESGRKFYLGSEILRFWKAQL